MTDISLAAVLNELGLPSSARDVAPARTVPRARILQLMKSHDLEILGALYVFIMNRRPGRGVEPPLTFQDYKTFLLRYYRRCLLEDPDSNWASSRYSAGWDLVSWFGLLWRDRTVPRTVLAEIKGFLAQLYLEGDEAVRTCIVTATLEHLFEQRAIRRFFAEWRDDPVLSVAYRDASDWSARGGATPLGRVRPRKS
jgi:hypothetical protein